MTYQKITIWTYSQPKIESIISDLKEELVEDLAPNAGKNDGLRSEDITQEQFAGFNQLVHSKVSGSAEHLKHLLLPSSQYFSAKDLESESKTQINILNLELAMKEQSIPPLERKQKGLEIDHSKIKKHLIFLISAIAAGCADGAVCFASFRSAGYPFFLALIATISVAATISVSHLAYADWIMRSSNYKTKITKSVIVVLLAFILFAFISHLRSDAASQIIDVSVTESSAIAPMDISAWAITIISWMLFIAIFAMALHLWTSKEERKKLEEYKKVNMTINRIKKEVSDLQNERKSITEKLNQEKRHTRDSFEYCIKGINRLKNIGNEAIATYKTTYALYHHRVPKFFEAECSLQFDESFNIINPQTELL